MSDGAQKLLEKAVHAEDANDPAQAERLFNECLAPDPNFGPGCLLYGHFLKRQKRLDEAINLLERAEQDPKTSMHALRGLGQVFNDMKMWSHAEEALRKSLAIDRNAISLIFLGIALSSLDRDDEALASYKAALQIEPNNEEAYFNIGGCYLYKKDSEQAIVNFRRAIEIDPEYALAYQELGYLVGSSKSGVPRPEARQMLETSTRLNPKDFWTRLYFANLLWNLDELSAAEVQYKAAVDLAPDVSLVHTSYGEFLAETKGSELAKPYFKKAVEVNPEDESALYHFGRNLLDCHHRKEGERYLKRVAELGNQRAKNLLNRLYPYVPKQERWQICAECGASLEPRNHWWCSGCGADLRIKVYQRTHEYHVRQDPFSSRPALPR
jgi:tetratricopeptide (TPR) repeat protein